MSVAFPTEGLALGEDDVDGVGELETLLEGEELAELEGLEDVAETYFIICAARTQLAFS
jgi:hypothetical protein